MQLPVDPTLVQHKCKNGLTVLVKSNNVPANRAELRLLVRVGSINERDSEHGVAHLCEHLAFRSTAAFQEAYAVVRYLESNGVRFGPCQNAVTTFDETMYELHVPTNRGMLLENALFVMKQWAFHVRASDEDVQNERGIILDELRSTLSGATRQEELFIKTVFDGSLYSDRFPIGTEESIRNVLPAMVRNFYRSWYHPENMAVVCVGDFANVNTVIQLCDRLFGDMQPDLLPSPERAIIQCPEHTTPRICVNEDPEAPYCSVILDFKHPRTVMRTCDDLRRETAEQLFVDMFNSRLHKLLMLPNAPFQGAEMHVVKHNRAIEACSINTQAFEGREMIAVESVLNELHRVRVHGFNASEITNAKLNFQVDLQAAVAEKDQIPSEDIAADLSFFYLNEVPFMDLKEESEMTLQMLPQITNAEICRMCERCLLTHNCTINVARPKLPWYSVFRGQQNRSALEETLRNFVARRLAQSEDIDVWNQPTSEAKLTIPPVKTPGHVVQRTEDHALGLTELTLSNGVVVCIKSTATNDDEVLIRASAFTGLSSLPTELQRHCRLSNLLAETLGQFGYNPSDLNDMMAGQRAIVHTRIGLYTREISGECSPGDLEACLKLIYLLFTTIVAMDDPQRLASVLASVREGLKNQRVDPQSHFQLLAEEVLNCYNEELAPADVKDIDNLNVDAALKYYNECFAQASDFRFVFVGFVNVDTLLPLLLNTLGALPVSDRAPLRTRADIRPIPTQFPTKQMIRQFALPMLQPLSLTTVTRQVMVPGGPLQLKQVVQLSYVCMLYQLVLMEALRFRRGRVYNISVQTTFNLSPPLAGGSMEGYVVITFYSEPSERMEILDEILAVTHRLRQQGVQASFISRLREMESVDFETALNSNSFWADNIMFSYVSRRYTGNVAETIQSWLDVRRQVLEKMNPRLSRTIFNRVFPQSHNTVVLSLIPAQQFNYPLLIGLALTTLAVGAFVYLRMRRL